MNLLLPSPWWRGSLWDMPKLPHFSSLQAASSLWHICTPSPLTLWRRPDFDWPRNTWRTILNYSLHLHRAFVLPRQDDLVLPKVQISQLTISCGSTHDNSWHRSQRHWLRIGIPRQIVVNSAFDALCLPLIPHLYHLMQPFLPTSRKCTCDDAKSKSSFA